MTKTLKRYEYQRIRWAKRGVTKDKPFLYMLTLQVNLLEYRVTSFGEKVWLDNIAFILSRLRSSYSAWPTWGFSVCRWCCSPRVTSLDPSHLWRLSAGGLWAISLGWEHLADSQKLNFARFPKTRRSIFCFDGLMKNALIMKWMREC